MTLHNNSPKILSSPPISPKMTSLDTSADDSPIAPVLPIASTRLRSLILKKHLSTFYTKLTKEKKTDPHLTRLIFLNMFQIFQITKINFEQYLKLHKHSDTFTTRCDVTTQTDHTTIRPRPFPRNNSNRPRTELVKNALDSYRPSYENDATDDELQKDPPEAFLDNNSSYKSYTYVSF